jgi:hypothetical protein
MGGILTGFQNHLEWNTLKPKWSKVIKYFDVPLDENIENWRRETNDKESLKTIYSTMLCSIELCQSLHRWMQIIA